MQSQAVNPSAKDPAGSKRTDLTRHGEQTNLVQKLFLRETFGQVRSLRKPTRGEKLVSRFFTKSLPGRNTCPFAHA